MDGDARNEILEILENGAPANKSYDAFISARELARAGRPRRLYRYRAASLRVLDEIEAGTVWATNPSRYNDPLDCAPRMSVEAKEYEDAVKNWRRHFRVCSFSETAGSVLMWSHYADEHRGVAVEYDVSSVDEKHVLSHSVWPVAYRTSRVDFTGWYRYSELPEDEKLHIYDTAGALAPLLTKAPDWSYELEWRLVRPPQGDGDGHAEHVGRPSCVYLGGRMSESTRRLFREFCSPRAIQVSEMTFAGGEFTLRSSDGEAGPRI